MNLSFSTPKCMHTKKCGNVGSARAADARAILCFGFLRFLIFVHNSLQEPMEDGKNLDSVERVPNLELKNSWKWNICVLVVCRPKKGPDFCLHARLLSNLNVLFWNKKNKTLKWKATAFFRDAIQSATGEFFEVQILSMPHIKVSVCMSDVGSFVPFWFVLTASKLSEVNCPRNCSCLSPRVFFAFWNKQLWRLCCQNGNWRLKSEHLKGHNLQNDEGCFAAFVGQRYLRASPLEPRRRRLWTIPWIQTDRIDLQVCT